MVDAAAAARSHPSAAERALRAADRDSERLAAVIRVAIFVAIGAAVLVAQSDGFDHRPLVAATAVYGAGTLVSLALALRGVFRPWLPYAFVAMDVLTLAFAIVSLGRMLALPADLATTLPVGGLVLLVLVHASMHHRPALVGFGAALFAAGVLACAWLLAPAFAQPPPRAHAADHLEHFRLFPAAIFVLAAAILMLTTRRTRRFIEEAFAHASRAATLSRYFAPEVVEELTARAGGAASFGDRMPVAVVFADIRGFTALAESLDPAELARFLSEFRARIAAPALRHGGVVDKYIGDGIMVVFGAPRTRPDDAARALRCAVDMVDAMQAWSAERARQGRVAVAVAVGAHYGVAFAGVLSDGRLLEYTVIGDTVNVASRLADLARPDRTELVASTDLVGAAGAAPEPHWTPLPPQTLPGHPRAVPGFRIGTGVDPRRA